MLTQKNKPETDRELKHTELYYNGIFLGYVINSNSLEPKGFVFVNKTKNPIFNEIKNDCFVSIHSKTKKALIDKIKKLCENNLVN